MSTLPNKDVVKQMIVKLLEKANHHPELTPRILRTKIEEKLKLTKDSLKPKRDYIKKVAIEWWIESTTPATAPASRKRKAKEEDAENEEPNHEDDVVESKPKRGRKPKAATKDEAEEEDKEEVKQKSKSDSKKKEKESNDTTTTLQKLTKLATAASKGPQIFKSLSNLSEEEKIVALRSK